MEFLEVPLSIMIEKHSILECNEKPVFFRTVMLMFCILRLDPLPIVSLIFLKHAGIHLLGLAGILYFVSLLFNARMKSRHLIWKINKDAIDISIETWFRLLKLSTKSLGTGKFFPFYLIFFGLAKKYSLNESGSKLK